MVWPGAPENCADGIDNDCDTFTDGDDIIDCPSGCPDADGDGFPNGQCGGPDCNDSQDTWHPGADEEYCGGNTYDKNCDGTVNVCVELGGACTDDAQCRTRDCAPHFICIDANAVTVPITQVDDEGGCSATGAPVWPMAFVLLLLRRRRRRD